MNDVFITASTCTHARVCVRAHTHTHTHYLPSVVGDAIVGPVWRLGGGRKRERIKVLN